MSRIGAIEKELNTGRTGSDLGRDIRTSGNLLLDENLRAVEIEIRDAID